MSEWDKLADYDLGRIANALEELVRLAQYVLRKPITDFTLHQIKGDKPVPIQGTQLGTTSIFQIGLVPATNFVPLQSGPVVTVDDTNAVVSPVGSNLQFSVAIPANDTATSYNVTVSGVNGAGAAVTHTFNVPILAAPPNQVTDFSLNQIS